MKTNTILSFLFLFLATNAQAQLTPIDFPRFSSKSSNSIGYPWMNLIELNDKAQIWSKYGIPNAAGSTFLVDNTGRILAINPSAEEVETILEQTL